MAIAQAPSVAEHAQPETLSAAASETPIFVVGSGRSGSTLMASILHGHSALGTGFETGFFGGVAPASRRILEDPAWPDEAIRYLMSIKRAAGNVIANYGLDEDQLRDALDGRPRTLGALLDAVAGTHARRMGRRRWVEQTPTHVLNVRQIRDEWPDAPIIYVLRDPRGVVASYLKVPWGPQTVVGSAYLWQLYDDAAHASLDDDPHAIVVRYEALLANPEAETRRVCAFIGEAYEPGMLEPDPPSSADQRPSWLAPVAMNPSRAEAWRRELSAEDRARIELICSVGMQRRGYAGAGTPSHTVLIHPYDRYISAAQELLEQSADRSISLRPLEAQRDRRHPILFWGRPGHLAWTDSPIVGKRRSLAGWTRTILGARLRRRPLLWVAAGMKRPGNRSRRERVGDVLARLAVPRAMWPEALDRIAPATTDAEVGRPA